MKKTLLVLLVISLLALAACGSPATPAGVSTTGDDSDSDGQDGSIVTTTSRSTGSSRGSSGANVQLSDPFDLESAGIEDTFDVDNIDFVMRSSANSYGDKSSLIRVQGANSFEANMDVTYTYNPTSQLENANLFLKVLGADTSGNIDEEVYSGIVEAGTNEISFASLIPFHEGNVRASYCFGFTPDFDPLDAENSDEIYCKTNVGTNPENRIGPSADSFSIQMSENDRTFGTRDIFMGNEGTSDLTAFAYVPSSDDYELELSKDVFHLASGDSEEITIDVTWTGDGNPSGEAIFYIYSLADNCNPSVSCANGARILHEVEVNLR